MTLRPHFVFEMVMVVVMEEESCSRGDSGSNVKEGKKGSERKRVHSRECRRYRDKITNKFKALLELVPELDRRRLKHKADILDYTICMIRDMQKQIEAMDVDPALWSSERTRSWASKVAKCATEGNASKVAREFGKVVMDQRGWTRTRTWEVGSDGHIVRSIHDEEPKLATRRALKTRTLQFVGEVLALPVLVSYMAETSSQRGTNFS